MPVFFISSTSIHGKTITFCDPLYTHLCKSLRIRTGQILRVRDDQRQQYTIIINKVSKISLTGEIQNTLDGPPLQKPTVTLVQSILKPDHMTWSIQKATELGVNSIVPIITERVQSRSGHSLMKHYRERWQKIALEAAQQSERWDIPHILQAQPFTDFLQDMSPTHLNFLLSEREESETSSPISFKQPINTWSNVVMAVGPEGGWSQKEIQKAEKAGFRKITLGGKLLRSETATVAGLVMLQERLNQLTFTAIS